MCLAIFKPAKVAVPEANLHQGWIRNPDGGGFAYVHKGKVHVVKGLMTWKDFLAAYLAASSKFKDSPFLIHFRIRSLGDKSDSNTHPFMFKYGALIHNGTIDGTGAKHAEGKSDTALFAEKVGDYLDYENTHKHKKEWDEALSAYNKVVILYNDKKHLILNEDQGKWDGDVWYSNPWSYRPVQQQNNNYVNSKAIDPWENMGYD